MSRISILYILTLLLVAMSCSDSANDSDKPVAKVGDKYLYLSEVYDFVPNKIGVSDSTLMAEDYIKKWIQKELLIKKAEENLSHEQKDVSKELEEYKNSLIIYKYKNELVAQKMDTTVLDSKVEEYYNNNIETFKLNRSIVKAIYLKISVEVANPDQLKLYCENKSDENFRELKEYCMQYAKSFDTFEDTWIEFFRVMNNVPNEIEDLERFLSRNELFETSDSEFYYLICIKDFKMAGQPAPIEYVSEQIKSLILNKRKLEFLKNIELDIYNDGVRNNKFNIYNVE